MRGSAKPTLIVFLMVGPLFLFLSAFLSVKTLRFQVRAIRVPGTVLRLDRTHGRRSTLYRPVVRFLTREGEPMTAVGKYWSNPAMFTEGEAVTVLYEPGSPRNASIESFGQQWLPSVMFAGFGLIFAGIPAAFLWKQEQHRRRGEALKAGGPR